MKYHLSNPSNNIWFSKCNKLIALNENNIQLKLSHPDYVKYSKHHILPRFEHPELTNDPNNLLFLPVMDHIQLHYYMWKGDRKYASAFWFCYVYFHKHYGYSITDDEYLQLKEDVKYCRKKKKDQEFT